MAHVGMVCTLNKHMVHIQIEHESLFSATTKKRILLIFLDRWRLQRRRLLWYIEILLFHVVNWFSKTHWNFKIINFITRNAIFFLSFSLIRSHFNSILQFENSWNQNKNLIHSNHECVIKIPQIENEASTVVAVSVSASAKQHE